MISLFASTLAASLAVCSGASGDPARAVAVNGAVAKPASWTGADLRRVFSAKVQTIRYTLKGHDHTALAIPLYALIEAAGPRYNAHIKNHPLQFVAEVQGRDGYTADFTLAELSPEIGNRSVWVTVEEDGAPLADESDPADIVSPDDRKPARWVHGVQAITVIDTAGQSEPEAGHS